MKRISNVIIFLVVLGNTVTAYSQEEFYGNHSGFSANYARTLTTQENGGGASIYIKNKMIIGVSTIVIDYKIYPVFSILACPHWGESLKQPKFGYGLSYSYVNENHIAGINLLLTQPFFAESKFPFSIQGNIAVFTILNKYMKNNFDIYPEVGIGYVQTFFANSKIYPLIGISYATDLNTKMNAWTVNLGINIPLN